MKDTDYMLLALEEANKALEHDDIPVGCIIVCNGKIISKAHNTRFRDQDITGHAEINAIKQAIKCNNTLNLSNCEMYVTLEPCLMCCGAIYDSKIKALHFGAYNKEDGCVSSLINYFTLQKDHIVKVSGGILEEECKFTLSKFFSKKR